MREHDEFRGGRARRRFDDDEPFPLTRASRHGRDPNRASEMDARDPNRASEMDAEAESDHSDIGDRWSTWDMSTAGERGPTPYPDWLVTELAAVDTELGILKSGKEADVCLVSRAVPGTDRGCLLAAKRYRDPKHRMFHRDVGYLDGRKVRESRVSRAMARRTEFGRQAIAGQWAAAEFAALCQLHQLGVAVPYPVQLVGTELLIEFIGDERAATPRLAQVRPAYEMLADLWEQLRAALVTLARAGYAHGDLSAYNLLVHRDRLVLIDLPQFVDIVVNPQGPEFLARDVRNVAAWFTARGFAVDADVVVSELAGEAGLR